MTEAEMLADIRSLNHDLGLLHGAPRKAEASLAAVTRRAEQAAFPGSSS